jgi:hypothetical protein
MRVIVIHHVQKMWDSGLLKYGTSFEEEIEKVYNHLLEENYDRVIVTNFEAAFGLDDEQKVLSEFYPDVYDYMYGWEDDEANPEGTWVDGGCHSQKLPIDDWMLEIINDDVFLCGAFDGECIEDMEIALSSQGIKVNRIEQLIT